MADYVHSAVLFVCLVPIAAILTWLCKKHVRIMDHASERSMHKGALPRSGGVAIVVTCSVGIVLLSVVQDGMFSWGYAFWGVSASAFLVAVVGFYDDITAGAFRLKLLSQFASAAVLIMLGMMIRVRGCIDGGVIAMALSYFLTVLWIVGITNAFNFMDGLNGLAAGVAVIVSIAFAAISASCGGSITAHMSVIVAASCIGFLFYNFPKATVFMGDVGSTFLGYCLGALALLAASGSSGAVPFMVMPLLLANFVMETFFTFIWRLYHKQPVHKAHRMHPYQLLRQMGLSTASVTMLYYVQSLVLALLGYAYLHSDLYVRGMIIGVIVLAYMVYFLAIYKAARMRGMLKVAL